ncbi:MAG TPA: circadian clock KaiB family protein [Gammaproteobacteria bacterium]|nr:circadian clock KaiB family protein [Gammaproteobacteria bacterium]
MTDKPSLRPRTSDPPLIPAADRYLLRLYVSGGTERSTRAIENLRHVCERHLDGRYDLEVIDIYQHPEAARAAQIVAAPTLVKATPAPLRRIIGDLSDQHKVLHALNLTSLPTPPDVIG